MARPRTKPDAERRQLTAIEVGGSDPDVVLDLAVAGEYPEDHENEGTIWKAGYDKACVIGTSVKSAIIFANNFQGEDLSDDAIAAEIARLTKIQNARS